MIFDIDNPKQGDKVALIEAPSGESWTYSRLADEVRRCGCGLAGSGKSLVFHSCSNTLQSVAWYLGAVEAGHAVALLAPNLNPDLRARLLEIFQPEFFLSPESPGLEYAPTPVTGGLWQRRDDSALPPISSALALLLPTSGTTGSAKFVRLTKTNLEANAHSIAHALGLTAGDRPIAHLPLHYSYGLSVLNSHLAVGATTILTGESIISPAFWKSVAELRVSSFSGVPYTYQMLRRLNIDNFPAESIHTMTQAGGKLDEGIAQFFHEKMRARNGAFWIMYGQTEATARIAVLPPSMLPDKIGTAGMAIPGGSLAILTGEGVTTQPGIAGELVYSGPNVMMGYALDRADLAKGDKLAGVLHTGDRAFLDADMCVTLLGRTTRDAKVFGLRINLDDVEAMLTPHGPAAVVAGVDKLIAYCEFGTEAELRALQGSVSSKLHIHPSALDFRQTSRLPVTGSGKVDYAKLDVR